MKNFKLFTNLDRFKNIKFKLNKKVIVASASIVFISAVTYGGYVLNKNNQEGINEIIVPRLTTENIIEENNEANNFYKLPQVEELALMSIEEMNNIVSEHGEVTLPGMPAKEFNQAMNIKWKNVTKKGEFEVREIDLKEVMNFDKIEDQLFNMSKYDGVELYSIGKTDQKRDIYMLQVALPKEGETEEERAKRPVVMILGSVNAHNGAGTEYSIKALNDVLIQAMDTPYARALFEEVIFTVVPNPNPDGREYVTTTGEYYKANGNGVDLNGNFPTLTAGQKARGVTASGQVSTKEPGKYLYPGSHLGSEKETQSLMNWMHKYVPNATVFMQLDQYGGFGNYASFFTGEADKNSKEFLEKLNVKLNKGYPASDSLNEPYFNGRGGTPFEYVTSIAGGGVFSPTFGRLVTSNGKLSIEDSDNIGDYYNPINKILSTNVFYIGDSGASSGYSEGAQSLKAKTYDYYNWNRLFRTIPLTLLKEEEVEAIRERTIENNGNSK